MSVAPSSAAALCSVSACEYAVTPATVGDRRVKTALPDRHCAVADYGKGKRSASLPADPPSGLPSGLLLRIGDAIWITAAQEETSRDVVQHIDSGHDAIKIAVAAGPGHIRRRRYRISVDLKTPTAN